MEAEQVLLDDIRRGDRAAMRRLYDRYSGYATAVGLRYIPDREDLRDVLQDCFVKIFTSIGRFEYRGEGSVRGWIARIVANEALDFLRRNQRFCYTDERLGIRENSSASQFSRAKRILRKMINEYLKNNEI